MGNNNEKENDSFGRKFDIAQHNRKMAGIRQNYMQHSLDYQKPNVRMNLPKQQSYQTLQRKNAIFKPSININFKTSLLKISFEYKSDEGCQVFIFVGVNNINQDLQTKNTTDIQSDYRFNQRLQPGNKIPFLKQYQVNSSELASKQVILRIQDQLRTQSTEYSLRKLNQKEQHWKIILEKLEKDHKAYELENIYGSGSGGQQCIVCMCQPSNTLVKPCNHMCLCKDCAASISARTNKCPICRKGIIQLVTISSTIP